VTWDGGFLGVMRKDRCVLRDRVAELPFAFSRSATQVLALILLAALAIPGYGREKSGMPYGEGLIVTIPLPEPEVAQAVEDAVQNTIIRGTKEYSKDEYVAGAVAVNSTPVFPKWTDKGKVSYKVRKQALNPWNFKDSADVGTLAVRYVVQPQGDKNTILRIDAVFVEDFRHVVHASNGSVESAECKDIQDRLASVELVKKETEEALRAKRDRPGRDKSATGNDDDSVSGDTNTNGRIVLSTPPATESPVESDNQTTGTRSSRPTTPTSASASTWDPTSETLEQHVAKLRRQVERVVRQPGAPLKSAPFHTATTVKSLDPGAEVLILITTTYWYGIETHDGQHGWILRDQLESLP
jgi:hypothetical protein